MRRAQPAHPRLRLRQLALLHPLQDTCIAAAKAKALDDATVMRQELQDQYLQQEQVALEAERRCQTAELEISQCRSNISALKKEADQLMAKNRAIKLAMLSSSSWAAPHLTRHYDDSVTQAERAASMALPVPAAGDSKAGDSKGET